MLNNLHQYENLQQYFDDYYKAKYYKKTEETLFLALKSYANKQKQKLRLLDSGCGIGYFSKRVLEHLPEDVEKIVGLDIEEWIDKDLFKNKKFEFIKADATTTNSKLKSSSFDVIVSNDILEHVENDSAYLRECSRLIKKNGILILMTPNLERFTQLLSAIFSKKVLEFPKTTAIELVNGKEIHHIHLREYNKSQLQEKIVKEFPFSLWVPLFVGIKVPWFNFVGSYNLKINKLPFLATHANHFFVICSKNSQIVNTLSSVIFSNKS